MPSPIATIFALIAFAAALPIGRQLHRHGISAANALEGRQRGAYAVLVIFGGAVGLLFIPAVRDRLPLPLVLGLQHYLWPALVAFAAASAGLLVGLEAPGWQEPARRRGLLTGGIGLLLAAGLLLSQTADIIPRLGPPRTDGELTVLQTSNASCAAAAMATLARVTGIDPLMTERAMAERAGTSKLGTSTIGELRALRDIGATVRFARRLTADSLRALQHPALLHVEEPIGSTTISHAVALVGYDATKDEFLIANPLYGMQRYSPAALQGYWRGEAIFLLEHRVTLAAAN